MNGNFALLDYYPLEEAARRFFPREAKVTTATLRREVRRGSLHPVKLGGKYLVSRVEIDEMLERLKCRVPESPRASICELAPAATPSGSSSIADAKLAQHAAEITLLELSERYRPISPRSASRPAKTIRRAF